MALALVPIVALALAYGCAPATSPAPPAGAPAMARDGGPDDTRAPADPAVLADADTEPGTRLPEKGAKLADGTLVEVDVASGDAEIVSERWVVHRDSKGGLRAREITPKTHELGSGRVTLSLGDRATSGDWEVEWFAVRDGLATFRGRHRKKLVGEWKSAVGQRPTHELASANELLHFEVTLLAASGAADRAGATVAITGDWVEHATPARFGQALAPGFYVFPDGLRMRLAQIASCDFDTSVPCYGGTYRAEALVGGQDAKVEWSSRTARLLRYSLTVSSFKVVVSK